MSALLRRPEFRLKDQKPSSVVEIGAPFDIIQPVLQNAPALIASPHSGRAYPEAFVKLSCLNADQLRSSEDSFVDELFLSAPSLGVPLIRANFPRAYVDVNREPYELDPDMFDGPLPVQINSTSRRVVGGLGTIPRVVAENQYIYRIKLPPDEATRRIENYYYPYHHALERLLLRTRKKFGLAVLIDCHSMPTPPGRPGSAPEFILGDRFGTAAAPWLVIRAEHILQRLGYKVSRNVPYAGGYTTEHYGRPDEGLHALQIEIDRSVYMTSDRTRKHKKFKRLQADLSTFMQQFFTSLKEDAGLTTTNDHVRF